MSKYAESEKQKCFERIRNLCASLPSFCVSYINTISTRKETSFRTGMQYAYEISTFIDYVAVRNGVSPALVTARMLSSLLPLDIDEYISHLASYETPEDRAYNKERADMVNERGRHVSVPEKHHHKSVSARARSLSAVRGLYQYLMKNQLVSQDPAKLAQAPVRMDKPVIALDPEEVHIMMENVENNELPGKSAAFSKASVLRDTALITLLLYTGIRASECAGLDIEDINWVNNSARVLRKGGNYELVYFNDMVASNIRVYIDNERVPSNDEPDALFVSRFGTRLSPQSINNVIKKYGSTATYKHITTHKMRSSYATQLYKQTGDAMMVKDALGHTTLGVVQKYIAAADENRQEAAKTIDY